MTDRFADLRDSVRRGAQEEIDPEVVADLLTEYALLAGRLSQLEDNAEPATPTTPPPVTHPSMDGLRETAIIALNNVRCVCTFATTGPLPYDCGCEAKAVLEAITDYLTEHDVGWFGAGLVRLDERAHGWWNLGFTLIGVQAGQPRHTSPGPPGPPTFPLYRLEYVTPPKADRG